MASKPGPIPYPGYMTAAQQVALAQKLAAAALQPAIQQNQNQQRQSSTDAMNQAASMRAGYDALAKLQGDAAPQIEQAFGGAADRQAVYAKGYSDTLRALTGGAADQANQIIQQNGQQAHIAPATGAADVAYNLGGVAPANLLSTAGAAFGAAARNLPAQSTGLGVDASKAAFAQGAANKKTLLDQLSDLQGRRPGLIQQSLSELQGQQANLAGLDVQRQYLLNTVNKTNADVSGYYTGTDGKRYPTANTEAQNANANAQNASAAAKKAKARAAAVGKRNDATIGAVSDATDFVDNWAATQHTQLVKTADVPIVIGRYPDEKDANGKVIVSGGPMYAKVGGGITPDVKQAATKPEYDQQPLPKPKYRQLRAKVLAQLRLKLKRYGYKDKELQAMADDILNDYYTPQEMAPSQAPTRTDAKARPTPDIGFRDPHSLEPTKKK